jgi:RNA polymerase sigma-70 factor (ECF subfamily)
LDWEQILDEHGSALLLYARQWTRSWADAEDALQNAFIRLFKSRGATPDAALPMLYQAVKWAAIDQARSRQRRQAREERSVEGQEEHVALFESDMENRERNEQVQEALQALPDEQREVLVMKVWGELTFREIADALQIPQGTAASRYRYALEALRGELDPEVWHAR